MNKRPPSNQPALESLKNQGYKIIINHYRRVPIKNIEGNGLTVSLIEDFEWRQQFLHAGFYYLPEEKGGATKLTLIRGEEKIVVRADVFHRDNFCRRTGVAVCLSKFDKIQKGEI